jgi:hypothetical protein
LQGNPLIERPLYIGLLKPVDAVAGSADKNGRAAMAATANDLESLSMAWVLYIWGYRGSMFPGWIASGRRVHGLHAWPMIFVFDLSQGISTTRSGMIFGSYTSASAGNAHFRPQTTASAARAAHQLHRDGGPAEAVAG